MAVAEVWADGVVANQIPAHDRHSREFLGASAPILVPEDIFFADVLCAGGVRAQKLSWKVAFAAIVPDDTELSADELDGGGLCHVVSECAG